MAIDSRGKLGYLTGEESHPEATNPSFRKWRSENSLITAWLLNSMEDHIRKPFMFMEAKDIWESVRETYSDLGNSSQIFELKNQIWLSRQGGRPLTVYFNEMLTLWQELDLYYKDTWENARDLARFTKREANDRVFMFLVGVDSSLMRLRAKF